MVSWYKKVIKNWRTLILELALCTNNVLAAPQILDKVVAVVNSEIILESDVNKMLTTVKRNAQESNQQLPDNATIRSQIVEQLIMDNIILQLAQRANITISDEQLDQAIGNIAAQNHMTIKQLLSSKSYAGMDCNTYRAQIRKKMLITKVSDSEVRRRVVIFPQEVNSLTQQIAAQIHDGSEFNLSHILIPLSETPTKDQLNKAKTIANAIIEESKNNADFDKLAITYSNNLQPMINNQMGWKKIEELPSLFVERLHGAHKGNIIGPILSGVGFHILKVNDIRDSNQKVTVTEVHARHILLRTSVLLTDQQARTKLEDVAAQIKTGSISFGDAAKQLSEDYDSVNHGGDLGLDCADAFDSTFRNALMHLKKGEISNPVHSAFGWHLIQLIDTRQVDRTDAALKGRVYQLLFNRKFTEEIQTWMQELRAASYVRIIDNNGQ